MRAIQVIGDIALRGVPTLLCAAALVAVPASAMPGVRTLGMGEAAIAVADPTALGRENPAELGFGRDRAFRMNIFDVGVAVGNSAFSLNDYNTYNGAVLTDDDKADILSRFGDEGWIFRGEASGYGPSVAYGPAALSVRGVGSGSGAIPEDVLRLLLDGNTLDETIDFSDAEGGGWAALDASLGFGWALDGLLPVGKTSFGVKAHYLKGVFAADILRAEGTLMTSADSLSGTGELDLQSSSGGTGYSVDVGALHEMGPWRFGMRVNGLVGSINWTEETERHEYRVRAKSPDFLSSDDDDDLFTSTDSTYATGAFSTRLPLRIGAGAAWDVAGFTLAGDLEHTAAGRQVGEAPVRLSVGAERYVLGNHLGLRAGGMLGGLSGPSITGGTSLRFGLWRLDLDAGTYGTLDPFSPKGLRFAIGSSIGG